MTATLTVSSERRLIEPLVSRNSNSERKLFGEVGQLWGPNLSMFLDRQVYVYFHGELERQLEFDIPVFLNGEIEFKEVQDILVINPHTDETLSCKLYLWRRDYMLPNSLYGLVVFPHEEELVLNDNHIESNNLKPLI